MAEFPLSFGTQSHGGRFPPLTGPRQINAYVEEVKEGEPPFPYIASDGLKSFGTVGSGGACRGFLATSTYLYVASGTTIAEVDASGNSTSIGNIAGTAPVIMARNAATPFQIAMVSEGKRYSYSGGTFMEITDADLPPPNSVTFADQRVIYTISDGRIFWSDIDDVTSINGLSFSTAEGAPDGLVRGYALRLDVWLFGARTTEIWRSTADSDEPFRRVSGGYLEQGCDAPHSIANLNEVMLWVNDKEQVVAAAGYQPQVISHHGVHRDIASVQDKTNNIIGSGYFADGTPLYVLTSYESGNAWTWVYNLSTQRWFEKKSATLDHWTGKHIVHYLNKWIAGDYSAATLYELDADTYDENGSSLVWELRSAPLHAFPHRVACDTLYLDFVTGVGLNSTDTDQSNPQVMLDWSDDGGRNYSNQLTRTLGAEGAYQTRVSFNNLGVTGRNGRIFRIRASANVAKGLKHAAINGDLIGT